MNNKLVALLILVWLFTSFGDADALRQAQERPIRLAQDKPNIVFIMADDMGMECLSSYGSATYQTPNLDRLAANGVRFEHCYSTPLCTPSRVQVMTGLYNFNNYLDFGTLRLDQTTFANLLKDQGYATCIAGKWQLGGDASTMAHFGFDQHCVSHLGGITPEQNSIAKGRYAHPQIQQNGRYLPDEVIRDAYGPDIFCDFIIDFIEENQNKPFFAYYPMVLVHSPFGPTPDSEEWKEQTKRDDKDVRYFKEMVAYADKLVGRIFHKIEELELSENTLIVFTGDNGTHPTISSEMTNGSTIHGGKGTMPDAGTHVPLIVSWKGVSPTGVILKDLVDFSDFLPTFLDASGKKYVTKHNLDGRSFLAPIRGEVGSPRHWAFCHYDPNFQVGGFQLHAGRWARDQQFKLYEDGHFYDVANDPLEKHAIQSPGSVVGAFPAKEKLREVLQSMPPWVELGEPHRHSEQNKKYISKLVEAGNIEL
jgi:arylsulfatase A